MGHAAREFFALSNAIRRPSGRAPDFRAFRRISGRFALIFTAFRLEVSGVSPGNPAIRHGNPPARVRRSAGFFLAIRRAPRRNAWNFKAFRLEESAMKKQWNLLRKQTHSRRTHVCMKHETTSHHDVWWILTIARQLCVWILCGIHFHASRRIRRLSGVSP